VNLESIKRLVKKGLVAGFSYRFSTVKEADYHPVHCIDHLEGQNRRGLSECISARLRPKINVIGQRAIAKDKDQAYYSALVVKP